MKHNKQNKIHLYILVGIVFLLVLGSTYAYFSTTLVTNSGPNDIVTTTGTLELNYEDGDYLSGNNIIRWNRTN